MLQNKPVYFNFTDKDLVLLHKGISDLADMAAQEAPPEEAYAWAKLCIQFETVIHQQEICPGGEGCVYEKHLKEFEQKYKSFIQEEIKPFNQTNG